MQGEDGTLIYTHSLISVGFEDFCSFFFQSVSVQSPRHSKESYKMLLLSPNKNIPFSAVLPAVVEVELWRGAGGLGDRALLGSSWCRLGGCWCRRASHCLAYLSWCLARLGRWLTCLSRRLAGLGASLAWLGYRTGLGLRAVFLGHGALLL